MIKDYGFKGDLFILGGVRKNMAVSPFIYYKTEDLEEYAKAKKIFQKVRFAGLVPKEDMNTLMDLAKCFVSISLYEGFGLPALEAMTAGTPSVLSNLGAYPEIADGAALFVYPYGPNRIAHALNEVLTNSQLREKMIKKGKEKAKNFDRIEIAKRVLDIYKEVYDDYKIPFESEKEK